MEAALDRHDRRSAGFLVVVVMDGRHVVSNADRGSCRGHRRRMPNRLADHDLCLLSSAFHRGDHFLSSSFAPLTRTLHQGIDSAFDPLHSVPQCSCSLLLQEFMPFLYHNACLEPNHCLQTLITDHPSHLCVRSSHQAIHHASAVVSAVASAGRAAAIASSFFHRRQQQEVSSQESHRTGRSPKSVGGDVQTSDGKRRDSRIPLNHCG